MRLRSIWLVLVSIVFSTPSALCGELPFVLPDHKAHDDIPDNQGMAFFYGVWSGAGYTNSHVTYRITPDTVEMVTTDDADMPYRVVAEAPNYVLLLVRYLGLKGRNEDGWNSFYILTYDPAK